MLSDIYSFMFLTSCSLMFLFILIYIVLYMQLFKFNVLFIHDGITWHNIFSQKIQKQLHIFI